MYSCEYVVKLMKKLLNNQIVSNNSNLTCHEIAHDLFFLSLKKFCCMKQSDENCKLKNF